MEQAKTVETQTDVVQYVYEEPDMEMEGGSSMEMEGGQKFPTKKEAKEQFILFRAFWCVWRNVCNFLSALWKCEDGKCRPTVLGWIVILASIGLFVYFTFFHGEKGG